MAFLHAWDAIITMSVNRKRPQFFIENQMNRNNPHDRVSPETSRDVIISHTTDGADMLRKHKLPKEIIDIAEHTTVPPC